MVSGFVVGIAKLTLQIFSDQLPAGGWLYQFAQINFLCFCIYLFFFSILVMVIVSLFTPKPHPDQLKGLTFATTVAEDRAASRASPSESDLIRNPKSEIRRKSETRNPKAETDPKPEVPKSETSRFVWVFGYLVFGFVSDFELRISDFFRISTFGFRILLQFFLAQQNHAHHRHEQQHGDDFERQRVVREQ